MPLKNLSNRHRDNLVIFFQSYMNSIYRSQDPFVNIHSFFHYFQVKKIRNTASQLGV